MQNFFKSGTPFRWKKDVFLIIGVQEQCSSLIIERQIDRHQTSLSFSEFSKAFEQGGIILGEQQLSHPLGKTQAQQLLGNLSEEEQKKIVIRYELINASLTDGKWEEKPEKRRDQQLECAKRLGLNKCDSDASIRRWHDRLKANEGNMLCLNPSFHRRGNRSRRIEPLLADLINEKIRSVYLTPLRRSCRDVFFSIKDTLKNNPKFAGVRICSIRTVEKQIAKIPLFDRVLAREGWLKAKQKFPSGYPVDRAVAPLAQALLDASPLDILVVNPADGKTCRPWITIVIDEYSRMVLGFYISLAKPSQYSTLMAIRHAILMKEYVKETYPEIEQPWPTYGLFSSLRLDNGSELHGEQVRFALTMLAIEIVYCPAGRPNFKGVVERFFRSLNEGVLQTLPGTTFGNYSEKGDYKSEKEARLTLDEVIRIVHHWIVDVYHVRLHKGLDDAPLSVWQKSMHAMPPRRLLQNIVDFDSLLWTRDKRKLQRYGVEWDTLFYDSPDLQKIAQDFGFSLELDLLIEKRDISSLRVINPRDGSIVIAYCTDSAYVMGGLSFADHQAIKKIKAKAMAEKQAEPESMIHFRTMLDTIRNKKRAKRIRRGSPAPIAKKTFDSGKVTQIELPLSPFVPAFQHDEKARVEINTEFKVEKL